MLHQIIHFAITHWKLASGFLIVAVLLIFEEVKNQGEGSGKLTSAAVTHLINREEAMIVDVRDAAAFREGHIVNAKNVPSSDFDRQQEKLLSTHRDRPVVLVDASGLKTPALLLRMKKAGFQKIFLLKGGIENWKLDGMPVVKK